MLFEIAIVLVVAKIFSVLVEKMKQPGVLGEILAGILLGPWLFGFFSGSTLEVFGTKIYTFNLQVTSPEFKELAFIGIIFLLFIVGLKTDTKELQKSGKAGVYIACSGLIFSFIFGYLVGMLFTQNHIQSAAVGTLFIATSITLTIRLLDKMNMLSSKVGHAVHTADILNDIILIFLFSFFIGEGNSFVSLLKIVFFFVVTFCIGLIIIWLASKKTSTSKRSPILVLTVGIVVCFLFAAFAENMGVAGIIGAFFAGLILRRTPQSWMLSHQIEMIGHTFFTPLFFVWVGASFNFSYFFHVEQNLIWFFVGTFVVVALVSRFIGCYIGARLAHFNNYDATLAGIGMMPRLSITLIMATTIIEQGLFGDPTDFLAQQILLATLLLIIVSTFLTPVLLKYSMTPCYLRLMKKNKRKSSWYAMIHSLRYRENKRIYF